MCSEVADVACTWKMSSNKLTWKNVKGVFENDRTWTSHLNGWSNIKIPNSFLCAYFFARTNNEKSGGKGEEEEGKRERRREKKRRFRFLWVEDSYHHLAYK